MSDSPTSETIDYEAISKKIAIQQVDISTQVLELNKQHDFVAGELITSNLKQNLDSYHLMFNTLPPSDRIILPDIDVDVPLLQSSYNGHIDQITKEDMDVDLFK